MDFTNKHAVIKGGVNGIGACWLGAAKPGEKMESALPYVIALAFGKPAEPLHREL